MTTAAASLIDPSRPSSWPEDVVEGVERLAKLGRLPDDGEMGFRDLLGDRPVALYHATRYLPHEVDAVLQQGLVPLSRPHRSARLDGVIRRYGAEIDDLETLRRGVLDWKGGEQAPVRLGIICGISPLSIALEHDPTCLDELLAEWGGESFHFGVSRETPKARALAALTQRSRPVIVEAGVRASTVAYGFQEWAPVFIASHPGEPQWREYFVTEAIPPDRLSFIGEDDVCWPPQLRSRTF